ncbi:MAG: flagellar biosynthetic protein FliQ, partial [Ruminococcus sp.]|nr:flagellar biosynthetic protein FliQ [Ruminococcus sp.]
MTNEQIGEIIYELFVLILQIAGPLLVISMIVGICISIIQAATQIHEQTITFVPKLLVIGL